MCVLLRWIRRYPGSFKRIAGRYKSNGIASLLTVLVRKATKATYVAFSSATGDDLARLLRFLPLLLLGLMPEEQQVHVSLARYRRWYGALMRTHATFQLSRPTLLIY